MFILAMESPEVCASYGAHEGTAMARVPAARVEAHVTCELALPIGFHGQQDRVDSDAFCSSAHAEMRVPSTLMDSAGARTALTQSWRRPGEVS